MNICLPIEGPKTEKQNATEPYHRLGTLGAQNRNKKLKRDVLRTKNTRITSRQRGIIFLTC